MQHYRVAILGCRGRGTAAGRAYHQHPRTEVVASVRTSCPSGWRNSATSWGSRPVTTVSTG